MMRQAKLAVMQEICADLPQGFFKIQNVVCGKIEEGKFDPPPILQI